MKKVSQVEILHWAKTRHNLNPKYIHKSLSSKDFDSLCLVLQKIKNIGAVVSVQDVVEEYLLEHGVQYLPAEEEGDIKLETTFFFNTHPMCDGVIEVDLTHILLYAWCSPSRSNQRLLRAHLKERGYEVRAIKPAYSARSENSCVVLKENYPLTLPNNLTKYASEVNWYKTISTWLIRDQPLITLDGEAYSLDGLGQRWEAYFTQRFIDLFNMSELEYIYQHPQIRGCYENAPPVLALCEMSVRDVFKQTPLKQWVHQALKIANPRYEAGGDQQDVFLDTIYDEVSGRLAKTKIKDQAVEGYEIVEGLTSIIVLRYVDDILNSYTSLL